MDMTFLSEFLTPVTVGICLCVGYIIKQWLPDAGNKYIPTVCAVLGLILALWQAGWAFSAGTVLSGLFSGLAATGLHQAFKQLINREDKE